MLLVMIGCSADDDDNGDDGASLIDTPTTYTFESRFSEGKVVSHQGKLSEIFD